MNHIYTRTSLLLSGMLAATTSQAAVDSYRFAHVTIATPWYIFLFLLTGIFAPFVLMVILAWRNAIRKSAIESEIANNPFVE